MTSKSHSTHEREIPHSNGSVIEEKSIGGKFDIDVGEGCIAEMSFRYWKASSALTAAAFSALVWSFSLQDLDNRDAPSGSYAPLDLHASWCLKTTCRSRDRLIHAPLANVSWAPSDDSCNPNNSKQNPSSWASSSFIWFIFHILLNSLYSSSLYQVSLGFLGNVRTTASSDSPPNWTFDFRLAGKTSSSEVSSANVMILLLLTIALECKTSDQNCCKKELFSFDSCVAMQNELPSLCQQFQSNFGHSLLGLGRTIRFTHSFIRNSQMSQ